MKVSVNVMGVKELVEYMSHKQELVKTKLPDGIRDATLIMHNGIKQSIAQGTNAQVAVDTGRFLNSVDFENIDSNTAKIFSELEYAKFIEYGTSKMAARPHFRNTMWVLSPGIKEVFNNKVIQIVKE